MATLIEEELLSTDFADYKDFSEFGLKDEWKLVMDAVWVWVWDWFKKNGSLCLPGLSAQAGSADRRAAFCENPVAQKSQLTFHQFNT